MTKKRIFIFVLLLCLFLISFIFLSFDVLGEEESARVYDISVIVRGTTSDSWTSIRQGAEQAASERNVNLSFITLTEENDQAEQISFLYRELDGGADAIVLSAASFDRMAGPVGRISEQIPVVCVESNVDHASVCAFFSANNLAMGGDLAQRILQDLAADQYKAAVLDTSIACENLQLRREGLLKVLGNPDKFASFEFWQLPDSSKLTTETLRDKLKQSQINLLIALEPSALELAGQLSAELGLADLKIYGIGNSGRIASYLEQNIICATIIQNDFGLGYLSVSAAVDAIEKRIPKSASVEHRLIDSTNMYDPQNQRLLFPFIR